jgi:hypothetical protein
VFYALPEGESTMPTCENCGAFVTARFARVFGDNDDRIHACTHCRTATEIMNGRASVEAG